MAGLIPPDNLERIRAASDVIDVIGSYIPLKRAGGAFVALCPFHKEKTPSFHVNPQRQIFHCFGCHKGGDVFKFVQEYENISFVEAVRRLAERAKIPLELGGEGDSKARFVKEALLLIHDQITQRWQGALNEAGGQIARDYLAKRKVPDDAVKLFKIGYAPEAWDDTVNWAKSKGHDLELVEKAGLIIRKDDRFYDRFRGRLMFPICDEQGRVIGFSGRILTGDEKTAKYLNSPETPLFTKSKVIYGLDKAKRAMLDAQLAIVCEGQLDTIACHMAGVQHAVAPQGTAFTPDQSRILKRYVPEVVLCFDSDTAGQNAAVRSLDHLLASGLAVRVATMPSPHDPDSYIKEHGSAAFKQLLNLAKGFFDYYLERLAQEHDPTTDKGRSAIVRAMSEALHKTGDAVLIDKHTQKTALRLGVSADSMRAQFRRQPAPRAQFEPIEEIVEEEVQQFVRPGTHELWLLKILFQHEDQAEWLAAFLDLNWLTHPAVRAIIEARLNLQREHAWQGLGAFLTNFEDANAVSLISEAATEERKIPNPGQQLQDIALKLRNQYVDREMASLMPKLGAPDVPDEEKMQLMRRQQQLMQLKRQPLQPLYEEQ